MVLGKISWDQAPVVNWAHAFAQIVAANASLIGPSPAIGQALLRSELNGGNDVAVTQLGTYQLNRRAVRGHAGERNRSNTIPDPHAIIKLLHQSAPGDGERWLGLTEQAWIWAESKLAAHGIGLAVPGQAEPSPSAVDWLQVAQYGGNTVSVGDVTRNYWRSTAGANPDIAAAEDAMRWQMRRDGFSRALDRDLIKRPWHTWHTGEIARLRWLGLVNQREFDALMGAAGVSRDADAAYAAQLHRLIPPPGNLMAWDARHLWDNGLADTYGLDRGTDGTPVADFWSKAQGLGARAPDLPGQPAEGNDWLKMEHRASHPLPGFGECLEMQWRFRPSADDPTQSVVPGTPPWTMQNTREVLQLHGYTEPVIEWMLGLAVAPLSFRIANHILIPSMRNDEIRREMERQLGPAQDWLTRMFMDHGQPSERARLLAQGMIEQADRSANAERWNAIREQRKQWRDTYLSAYELGTVSYADAHQQIQDEWFTDQMATRAMAMVDQRRAMDVVKRQLAALRSTWMRGAISSEQATTSMAALGVVGPRQEQYGLEWRWERTEAVRILNTGEILTALKNGLLTPQVATQRLLAMGWSQPDALVEVAQAEQAVAAARQKVATAQQRTVTTAREKQQRADALAAAKAAKEVAHAAKMGDRQQLAEVMAPHRLLMAQSKYYAAVHQGNAEYATAEKKHDEERMAAILQRQVADYHSWLLSQLKTVAGVNDGTATEDAIDTTPASGAGEGS